MRSHGHALRHGHLDAIRVAALAAVDPARAAGIEPIRALLEDDAYPALVASGAQLLTGPAGTNVNDPYVILVRR